MSNPSLLSVSLTAPLRYTPFDSGKYEMSPGLKHFQVNPSDPDKRLIQLDSEYPIYRTNLAACRANHFLRYYLEQDLPAATQQRVNQILIDQLCLSYPALFHQPAPGQLDCQINNEILSWNADKPWQHPVYTSLFDALASQIQEDLAIWQLDGQRDWLAALHVCAPNGWAPDEKIGLSFDQVHAPVPEMERQRANYLPLLAGLIRKPAFCRFIWDLRSDNTLNHHPAAADAEAFSLTAPALWVRLERQVLYGLPDCQAVLFTIRTYHYPVESLSTTSLAGIEKAVSGMSSDVLAYKRLGAPGEVSQWLKKLIAR